MHNEAFLYRVYVVLGNKKTKYDDIRYYKRRLACAKKPTNSQLNLPHEPRTEKNNDNKLQTKINTRNRVYGEKDLRNIV